jgi:hypothetical protein
LAACQVLFRSVVRYARRAIKEVFGNSKKANADAYISLDGKLQLQLDMDSWSAMREAILVGAPDVDSRQTYLQKDQCIRAIADRPDNP